MIRVPFIGKNYGSIDRECSIGRDIIIIDNLRTAKEIEEKMGGYHKVKYPGKFAKSGKITMIEKGEFKSLLSSIDAGINILCGLWSIFAIIAGEPDMAVKGVDEDNMTDYELCKFVKTNIYFLARKKMIQHIESGELEIIGYRTKKRYAQVVESVCANTFKDLQYYINTSNHFCIVASGKYYRNLMSHDKLIYTQSHYTRYHNRHGTQYAWIHNDFDFDTMLVDGIDLNKFIEDDGIVGEYCEW